MERPDPHSMPGEISHENKDNGLLFILSVTVLLLISPYFTWSNQLMIFRLLHLTGNVIVLFIILRYNDYVIHNFTLVLFLLIVSVYTMVAGTGNKVLSYLPLLAILFMSLKPEQQLRIFNYFTSILTVVYIIGLVSYSLSIAGLNSPITTAIATNPEKYPYLVFFGHVEEGHFSIYRFASIFDEPGVVGTLNGLVLAVMGISFRSIRSVVFLVAGIVSFSLAFYIILILILLFKFNLYKLLLGVFIFMTLVTLSNDEFDFDELIINRLGGDDGQLIEDNRTSMVFDSYFSYFVSRGGNDLLLGKGTGYAHTLDQTRGVSTYKTMVINYGIAGTALIVLFYLFCVYSINNTRDGWFLFFIFIISAYQRPDLLALYSIMVFVGGLTYMKQVSEVRKDYEFVSQNAMFEHEGSID
jgi:hypothetical protein